MNDKLYKSIFKEKPTNTENWELELLLPFSEFPLLSTALAQFIKVTSTVLNRK